MSFYDDASLVFLAGGAAGKDGKAYNIKPTGKITTKNLVDNGTFDSSTNWVADAGWSIADGKASTTGAQISSIDLVQTTTYANLAEGRPYKLQYTVSNYVAGTLSAFVRGTAAGTVSADGTYIEYATSGSDTDAIKFTADSSFRGKIDDVSIVEVESIPADFTFSRGTNLTATRVGKDGYIEKGRENLLLQSNNFDTTWANSSSTETSGQSGYDGSNNAWLLTKTAFGYIRQEIVSNNLATFSVYAKANTFDFGRIQVIDSAGNPNVFFDLSSGTIGQTAGANYIDSSIQNIGNGWYRISLTINATISEVRIYPAEANNNVGTNTGSIYIQDAQLEQGLVATDYIETGATTATAGLLEDEPRFDYSGGASCPALLLEPQRSNLLPNSEYFGAWNNARTIDTSNQAISSEGLVNATYLEQQSGQTTAGSIYYSLTFGSTADYTTSIFAKKGEKDFIVAYDKNTDRTYFNLDTGMVGTTPAGVTASIEDFGNGWYRCSATFNAAAGGGNIAWYLGDADNSTAVTDSGGVYIYGAQIEAGSYPTSYIPTYGSSATRDGDGSADLSDSMLTGGYDLSSSWSLFADANSLKKSGSGSLRILGLHTSGDYNVQLYVNGSASNPGVNAYLQNSVGYVFGFNSNDAGSEDGFKICLTYDAGTNKISYYINGSLYNSTTSALTFGDETYGYIVGPSYTPTATDVSVGLKQILFAPTAFSANDSEILTGATSYSSFAAMATSTDLNYTLYE